MKWLADLVRWIQSFFKREVKAPELLWVIVPRIYEKWVQPGVKAKYASKHYRAVFRNAKGERRHSKTKFKRAGDALEFTNKFNMHLCSKKRETNAR